MNPEINVETLTPRWEKEKEKKNTLSKWCL